MEHLEWPSFILAKFRHGNRLLVGASVATCCFLVPFPMDSAHAMELRWASGQRDIAASAQLCTLVVVPTAGSALPQEWRIRYVSEGDGLRFLPTSTDDPGPLKALGLPACAVGYAGAPADVFSNRDTVRFCSPRDNSVGGVCIVRIGSRVRANLELLSWDSVS